MKNPHQKSGDLSGDSKGKHHSHKAVYAKNLIDNILDWNTVNERYKAYLDDKNKRR